MDSTIVLILGILFLATLVRSTFGFGESLVAVPLLLFLIPLEVAVPLSVLLSIFIAAVVVAQDHSQVHFHRAKWLIVYAALGIPLGLLLLVYGDEKLVKLILGVLIILYSVYSLLAGKKKGKTGKRQPLLLICGFFSGILGGAYGLNGPPLVIYGHYRNWSARHFRATLQAYFLPASALGMIGYWWQGLWTWEISYLFLISLPVVIPAIFLGRYLNRQLGQDAFLRYLYICLIATGVLLIIAG